MRLLLTTDCVGGVWQYSTDLARALVPLGIEPILAVLGPSPSPEQRCAAEGLTLIETGLPLDWLADSAEEVRASGQSLADLARREKVDLVQLNAPALAATASFPVPVVTVAHSCLASWWDAVVDGDMPQDFIWRAALHGQGLRAADLAIAPTAAFADATQKAYGLNVAPTVVHNGRTPLRLPVVEQRDFAFTAGRLWDRGKNVRTLDAAAARLAIPLCAAGPLSGPNGDSIVLDHARALGTVGEDELARQLAARPVFVSAALYEPFGLAVLEAATAGCPLALSDIATFRELWNGAALFVNSNDPGGFTEVVGSLAADHAARADWGDKARARSARYTTAAMADGMVAAYRAVLGEQPVARAAA